MRTTDELAVSLVVGTVCLAALVSCGKESQAEKGLRREKMAAEAERDRARQAQQDLRRQIRIEQDKAQGSAADFTVAAVVSLSSVLATFLVLHLFLREMATRKALARLLRHIAQRHKRRSR